MDHSIRSTILRSCEVAWRRRLLVIVPLVLMIPISIGAAYLLAGRYTARSLVMLQETAASNPLAHEAMEPNADRMAQILKGLRALLASDRVLAPIVDDANGGPRDPAARASAIADLAKNVTLDLEGNDFLEFRLSGKSADGLGTTLQHIMTNLIEALVAPPGESAGSFVAKSIEESARSAKRQTEQLDVRMTELLPKGLAPAEAALTSLTEQKNDVSGKLLLLSKTIDKIKATSTPPTVKQEGASGSMDDYLRTQASLQAQLTPLTRQVDALAAQISAFRKIQSEKASALAQVDRLQARVQAGEGPFGENAMTNWTTLINAPNRLIIVDPPKDPEVRSTSRMKFILSGIMGGLLLGVALVILAEILDTTLRTPEQLAAVAGVPCLGVLPALPRSAAAGHDLPLRLAAIGVGRLAPPAG